MDLFDKCRRFDRAQRLIDAGLYPYFRAIESSSCTRVIIDGRELVMVGSNNYLGLTHDPRVIEAGNEASMRFGSGCTGSRFLNGTLTLHEELERRLAEFMGYPDCVTFSTGFQTNLGVISALCGRGDIIFCDKENHASILDGCRLTHAELSRFRHNDMAHLEEKLKAASPDAGKLIIVDGVFSMVGQLTKLPEIVTLARQYGARVMVDDAHGIGALGETGRGTIEHFGLDGIADGVDVITGTFSKSLASLGGFVVASEEVIHFVKHNARSLIFSASPSPSNTAAALAAVNIIDSEPWRVARLAVIAARMKASLDGMGYDTMDTETPIIPILVGSEEATFEMAKNLFNVGLFVNPVIPPGAPVGLIRTSFMAVHSDEELDLVESTFRALAPAKQAIDQSAAR